MKTLVLIIMILGLAFMPKFSPEASAADKSGKIGDVAAPGVELSIVDPPPSIPQKQGAVVIQGEKPDDQVKVKAEGDQGKAPLGMTPPVYILPESQPEEEKS